MFLVARNKEVVIPCDKPGVPQKPKDFHAIMYIITGVSNVVQICFPFENCKIFPIKILSMRIQWKEKKRLAFPPKEGTETKM